MLVSIAILTAISLYWWALELGRWQRSERAMLVTIVTALLEVQSVVRLPLGWFLQTAWSRRTQGVCCRSVLLELGCAHELPRDLC